jgi:phospholipase C
MTEIEQSFDRYFGTLPASDPLRGAHILNLQTARTEEVRNLAKAFTDIKAEINQRFVTNALDIVAPTGPVHVHMDYLASSEVNAFAFQFEIGTSSDSPRVCWNSSPRAVATYGG